MKTTFAVKHLDCASCSMVMEGICEDTPGVEKAEVDSRKRTLVVDHAESVKPEQLKQALDSEGYPVDIVP